MAPAAWREPGGLLCLHSRRGAARRMFVNVGARGRQGPGAEPSHSSARWGWPQVIPERLSTVPPLCPTSRPCPGGHLRASPASLAFTSSPTMTQGDPRWTASPVTLTGLPVCPLPRLRPAGGRAGVRLGAQGSFHSPAFGPRVAGPLHSDQGLHCETRGALSGDGGGGSA